MGRKKEILPEWIRPGSSIDLKSNTDSWSDIGEIMSVGSSSVWVKIRNHPYRYTLAEIRKGLKNGNIKSVKIH